MSRCFILSLPNTLAMDSLRQWILAFDSENKTETNCRIRFINADGCYCKLTVIPEDKHHDTMLHACMAFGKVCNE
jgi:hypothetical protein